MTHMTDQERSVFEAWAASIGLCVTGKYAETIDVLCAESAFKAGYQAGRAAPQSQPQETIAYVTRNEEGDPAMLFFDLNEARLYCNPDEEPEALVLAGSALQAQDQKDAARYRWLRTRWGRIADEYDGDGDQLVAIREADSHFEGWDVDPLSLDRAIDAAIAAQAKQGGAA